MNILHLTPNIERTESPFDSIRQIDAGGIEFWSARDLMPLLGYDRWENLSSAIERAMLTASNQGQPIENLFRDVTKKGAGRPQQDYALTRYAAYLVAMNGDPRKPEVATAQGYFAFQTRVAETQVHAAPDLTSLEGIGAILNAGKAALNRAIEAEASAKAFERRAVKSEVIVETIEGSEGFSLRDFHKQYFSDVPDRQFFELLYKKRLLLDQRKKRWDEKNQVWKDGKQHMHPAADGKPFFFLAPSIVKKTGIRYFQTKVRPGTPEVNLIAQLECFGLSSNRNQTSLNLKELA